MKKTEKHNPNRWIYYNVKSTLNVEIYLKMLDFLKKQDKSSRFFFKEIRKDE